MANCTSETKERIPGIDVMHYPFSMAINGDTLFVTSQSDGQYSNGRMISLYTNAIEQTLTKNAGKELLLPFNDIVTSNTLIPRDAGLIALTKDRVFFASRETGALVAVLRQGNGFSCSNPYKKLESCAEASFLEMAAADPYSIDLMNQDEREDKLIVTYLSSDRLDVVVHDRSKKGNALRPLKHFFGADLVREKLDAKDIANSRLITRKVFVANKADPSLTKVYFLLELYGAKSSALIQSKNAFIVAVLASDLLQDKRLQSADIELWNLNKLFNIKGAQDFYVDEAGVTAYLLARIPESLFKIDLKSTGNYENQPVCIGASSLAVTTDHDRLFIPCFKDNKVISFRMSSLRLDNATGFYGRGPSFIAIDEKNKKIFVSYNLDNKVGILDYDLNYLGDIFNQASSLNVGP